MTYEDIQRRWSAELARNEQWAGVDITRALEPLSSERRELVLELAIAWLDIAMPPRHSKPSTVSARQMPLFGDPQ